MADLLRGAGFTGQDVATGVAVGFAESRGNTNARHTNSNGSEDLGWLQINTVHKALIGTGSWSNPADNARMAHSVWQDAGGSWHPWSTFNSGSYLPFLPAGIAAAKLPPGNTTVQPTAISANPLDAISNLAKFLGDPNSWKRVCYVIAGMVLLVVGLFRLTGDNKLSNTTKSLAKKAAEVAVMT
jgi:hypothetical protein